MKTLNTFNEFIHESKLNENAKIKISGFYTEEASMSKNELSSFKIEVVKVLKVVSADLFEDEGSLSSNTSTSTYKINMSDNTNFKLLVNKSDPYKIQDSIGFKNKKASYYVNNKLVKTDKNFSDGGGYNNQNILVKFIKEYYKNI